jgi:hypothetical protein
LDAKDVGETRAAVTPEGAKDEVFTLLVEDQDAREHLGREYQEVLLVMKWSLLCYPFDGMAGLQRLLLLDNYPD